MQQQQPGTVTHSRISSLLLSRRLTIGLELLWDIQFGLAAILNNSLASYQSVVMSESGRGNPNIFGCASCASGWTPLSKFLNLPLRLEASMTNRRGTSPHISYGAKYGDTSLCAWVSCRQRCPSCHPLFFLVVCWDAPSSCSTINLMLAWPLWDGGGVLWYLWGRAWREQMQSLALALTYPPGQVWVSNLSGWLPSFETLCTQFPQSELVVDQSSQLLSSWDS